MTTRAIATTVEIDSHRRCEMLLRLIRVAAAVCRRSERMTSTPAESSCDLETHGVERRDQPGDEAEREHQSDRHEQDIRRHGNLRDELLRTLAHKKRHQRRDPDAWQTPEQRE